MYRVGGLCNVTSFDSFMKTGAVRRSGLEKVAQRKKDEKTLTLFLFLSLKHTHMPIVQGMVVVVARVKVMRSPLIKKSLLNIVLSPSR